MTILTKLHKKGCWILNKSHLSSDANKAHIKVPKKSQLFTKNRTKDEKFDARCQLNSINLYLGLFKQCQLLQSYYAVASRLLGGDLVSGEMVSSWWRDDRKPRFYRLRERVDVVQRPSNPAPKGALDVHISRNYILKRCVLSVASTRRD